MTLKWANQPSSPNRLLGAMLVLPNLTFRFNRASCRSRDPVSLMTGKGKR